MLAWRAGSTLATVRASLISSILSPYPIQEELFEETETKLSKIREKAEKATKSLEQAQALEGSGEPLDTSVPTAHNIPICRIPNDTADASKTQRFAESLLQDLAPNTLLCTLLQLAFGRVPNPNNEYHNE